MKKPHKHAELIKAWADGAEIEFYDTRFGEPRWKLTGPFPYWQPEVEFRIKPEPKPDMVYYGRLDEPARGGCLLGSCFTSHYDSRDQIKLVFDGSTGKIKSVEAI